MPTSRQIRLARRPNGMAVPEDFELVEVATPDAADGQVQLQALLMSVDPYIRTRLDDETGHVASQKLHEPVISGGIARVTQSRHPGFREGDLVRHHAGMQERFVVSGAAVQPLAADPALPLSVYTHVLGGTGLTAYIGLFAIGELKDGEQVFVSSAAGAVGSVAAQIAKIKDCYVVGSAGADDKVAWLRDEAGLDAVINYNTQPIGEALAAVTPKGLDVYFENVGGAHLDAALPRMNMRGRIPVCGMISTYNGGGEGVKNLFSLVYGRIRMQGYVVTDHPHLGPEFEAAMTGWLKAGRIKYMETVLDGFERAPEGLIGLFSGINRGKMLIKVAD